VVNLFVDRVVFSGYDYMTLTRTLAFGLKLHEQQINERFNTRHGPEYALSLFLKPENDITFVLFYNLLAFSLFRQLLNVNLSTETAVGTSCVRGTSQLFKSLQVFIGKGVGADRTERSRRPSLGSEELDSC
jgi:hypothetical protein